MLSYIYYTDNKLFQILAKDAVTIRNMIPARQVFFIFELPTWSLLSAKSDFQVLQNYSIHSLYLGLNFYLAKVSCTAYFRNIEEIAVGFVAS